MKPHPNKQVRIKDGKITGKNPVNGKQIGLGMDDTNGICVALQLLKEIPNIKACFTTEEENGFNGADVAAENIDFFHDVSYLIQADRHGASDLITYTNWIYATSELWLQEATPIMAKYGYKEASGIGTDIGVLAEKLQLSGVNVSCGYYHEHTDQEHTIINELQNCLNFIEEIIKTVPIDKQYEIKVDYYPYSYHGYGIPSYHESYKDWYSSKDSDNVDDQTPQSIPCDSCVNFDCMNCPYDVF